MVHKGEIIEKAIRASGMPITRVAKKIGLSPRHLYNIFEKYNVGWDTIEKIGTAIKYDFSKDMYERKETLPLFNEPMPEYFVPTEEHYRKAPDLYLAYQQLLHQYLDLQKELSELRK